MMLTLELCALLEERPCLGFASVHTSEIFRYIQFSQILLMDIRGLVLI